MIELIENSSNEAHFQKQLSNHLLRNDNQQEKLDKKFEWNISTKFAHTSKLLVNNNVSNTQKLERSRIKERKDE